MKPVKAYTEQPKVSTPVAENTSSSTTEGELRK